MKVVDDQFISRGDTGISATIRGATCSDRSVAHGRTRSGPGDWGSSPPYHHPVFVLTHHPRPSVPMDGGTTFHLVSDGIEAALAQAVEAAGGADVRLGGGPATIQRRGSATTQLGGGERLFDNLDGGLDGYEVVEVVPSAAAVHDRIARSR